MKLFHNHKTSFRYQMVSAIWYLVFGVSLFCLSACNEDDNKIDYTKYYEWRDANQDILIFATDLQQKDSALTYFSHAVRSLKEPYWSSLYHIVHKANLDSLAALKPRKDFRPFSTSTLSVHYTLYKTSSVYDKIADLAKTSSKTPNESWKDLLRNPGGAMDSIFFANAEDNKLKADTIESSQVAFFKDFTPNGVITGWGDILQQMYIGDHVVAFIPWFLAYGQAGSLPNIDPYSNLFFRIELCDITNWGGTDGNR